MQIGKKLPCVTRFFPLSLLVGQKNQFYPFCFSAKVSFLFLFLSSAVVQSLRLRESDVGFFFKERHRNSEWRERKLLIEKNTKLVGPNSQTKNIFALSIFVLCSTLIRHLRLLVISVLRRYHDRGGGIKISDIVFFFFANLILNGRIARSGWDNNNHELEEKQRET